MIQSPRKIISELLSNLVFHLQMSVAKNEIINILFFEYLLAYLIRSSFSSPRNSILIPFPSLELNDQRCPIPMPIEGCRAEYMALNVLFRKMDRQYFITIIFCSKPFAMGQMEFFSVEYLCNRFSVMWLLHIPLPGNRQSTYHDFL